MSPLLQQLSEALAETVETAGASVARVEGRDRLPATGLVWSADGVIVAAQHTLERPEVRVGLPDGRAVPARVVGRDPGVDLAVLKAEASDLRPALWAEPEALRVGALVLALGRPGARVLATLGVLSALDDGWRTPQGGFVDRFLQTDAVMFPGFSGGPLVDADGRVTGLTSSGLVSGQNLALPLATVRATVEALLAHGRVRRGYLGVGAQPVRLPESLRAAAGQDTGLLLMNVEPDGPAGRSGLLLGDTLVTLNGQPVRSLESLLAALGGDLVGRRVPARLVRGGQVRELAVLVGERSE
ncbi:MAG: serine protease [Anaerolineales bacterium]|nr:serine protease [Anaerolineales bacterium]